MAKPKKGDWLPGWSVIHGKKVGWQWNGHTWVQINMSGPTGRTETDHRNTNVVSQFFNQFNASKDAKTNLKIVAPIQEDPKPTHKWKDYAFSEGSDKKPFVQRIKREDGSNASLSETFSNEEFHPFGDPGKKNYKPNLNQFKLTSNKKEKWKGSNINPPREHWDKVKNPWFMGPNADDDWNEAKKILKINHEEWLRKRGRIK